MREIKEKLGKAFKDNTIFNAQAGQLKFVELRDFVGEVKRNFIQGREARVWTTDFERAQMPTYFQNNVPGVYDATAACSTLLLPGQEELSYFHFYNVLVKCSRELKIEPICIEELIEEMGMLCLTSFGNPDRVIKFHDHIVMTMVDNYELMNLSKQKAAFVCHKPGQATRFRIIL